MTDTPTGRYVIYSQTRGVYMGENGGGEPLWSKSMPARARQVIYPTYTRMDGQDKISGLWGRGGSPDDYKILMCYPSRGDGATTADLNSALIPVD